MIHFFFFLNQKKWGRHIKKTLPIRLLDQSEFFFNDEANCYLIPRQFRSTFKRLSRTQQNRRLGLTMTRKPILVLMRVKKSYGEK